MTDNNDVTKIKMFHEFLHDYMEDYEVRGDNGDYQPSKTEKFIAFDIIMGLIDTDEFKEYFIDKSEVDKNEQTLRDKIKNIFKWCDSKFKYIKKLEKRIHKQRLALRKNWEIVRMQQAYRKTPLKTMWFDKSIALSKDNHALRDELQEAEARLKTCLAVRKDELHCARVGAVKNIRAVRNKYKKSNFDNLTKYKIATQSINYTVVLEEAIDADIKQADGETNS